MNKINDKEAVAKRRGRYRPTFIAEVVKACQRPGASIVSVARDKGLHVNIVSRWVLLAEREQSLANGLRALHPETASADAEPAFVPLQLASSQTPTEIRIELVNGSIAFTVNWPISAGLECAQWMRELLR